MSINLKDVFADFFNFFKKLELWLVQRPVARDVFFVIILLILGVFTAMVIYRPWTMGEAPPLKYVLIDGVKISTGTAGVKELHDIARTRLQKKVVLTNDDMSYATTWEKMGADIDILSLERVLLDLAQKNSPAARFYQRKKGGDEPVKLTLPVSFDSDAAVEALVAIKEKLDKEPKDAKFNFTDNAVEPEEFGKALDVYGTIESMEAAIKKGADKVELIVSAVKPSVLASALKHIDVDTVAGFFETPYSRMKKDRDRTFNVTLGASMLDGHVIMPGELFSFNKTVGDRSQARGFRYAPVIAGGKVVEGMGGGTCQVASTLYAAAFFAGMVIEDRVPHSRPSSYIKLGLDATVSYPNKDLKIRNPLSYPVVIHFQVKDGIARVEIRAKERPFTVSLLRKTIGETSYPVRVVEDPLVPRGKEIITQRGVPGYKVQRFRIIERNKVAYRFQSFDRYPPTVEFVHKGTGDPVAIKNSKHKLPHADMHKPYRASSSLRMVQGVDLWYEKSHN